MRGGTFRGRRVIPSADERVRATLHAQGFVRNALPASPVAAFQSSLSADAFATNRSVAEPAEHHDVRCIVPKRRHTLLLAGAVSAFGVGLAGCNGDSINRLETGYRYQSLNDTEFDRMAYYVDRFSDEARVAEAAAEAGGLNNPAGPRGGR